MKYTEFDYNVFIEVLQNKVRAEKEHFNEMMKKMEEHKENLGYILGWILTDIVKSQFIISYLTNIIENGKESNSDNSPEAITKTIRVLFENIWNYRHGGSSNVIRKEIEMAEHDAKRQILKFYVIAAEKSNLRIDINLTLSFLSIN